MNQSPHTAKVRIWDLPTRLFHGSLALCVLGLIVTGKVGGMLIDWHARLGYAVLTLLLFRIVWGFVGGHWSRFVQFIPSPLRVWAYIRGRQSSPAGHNPLGALSVLAMLFVLCLQVGSGLIIDDEIAFTGPLYALAPSAWVSLASHYHKSIGQALVMGLVLLHLIAIVWHVRRHRNGLVRAMINGDQEVDHRVPASHDGLTSRLLALGLWLACVLATWALIQFGAPTI